MLRPALAAVVLLWAGTTFADTATWYQCCNPVTACGVRFNPDSMGAAHRTLPCGSRVKVTDLHSDRSVIVTIRDRGPFSGATIDLYRGAAASLGIIRRGKARVTIQRLN